MTRNMTRAIEKVIKKIKDVIKIQGNYTIAGDENCQKWLKSLKIEDKVRLFPDFYSAWITYEQENYLVLINSNFDRNPKFLQEETLNAGAWIAIIDELELALKKDPDESILEEILESEWSINKKEYKEVDFEEKIKGYSIKDFFPEIHLYKIIDRFTKKEELNQITGIALTETYSYCLLPYNSSVLQEFKNTFDKGNQYIPFENILASYVASDFKFAYLDLYRCIERLQPLYFLKDFYDKLDLQQQGKSIQDFYSDFYESTKLEPKFGDSLKKLLESITIDYEYANKQNKQSNTSKSYLDKIINMVEDFSQELGQTTQVESKLENFLNDLLESLRSEKGKQSNNAGAYLNNLRNQIVHLRPKQTNDLIPKSIHDWNLLIFDMLRIVQELYKEHQNLLTSTED